MNRSLLRAVAPLLVGIGLLMSASALQFSLLAVRADAEEFGDWLVALMSTCYFVGFLAGGSMAPQWIRSVGHVRTFSAMASLASVLILVQAMSVAPLTWLLARAGSGVCIAVMVTAVEAWLNAASDSRTRGTTLSLYMVVMQLSFAVGQLLVGTGDPGGFGLFALVSILLSLSLVPVLLGAREGQVIVERERLGFGALARHAPVGLAASLAGGLAWSVIASMLILVGLREGFTGSEAASIGVAGIIGAAAVQVPLGRLSDRVDRRVVIAAIGLATAIAGGVAAAVISDASLGTMWAVSAVLGATTLPAYPLAIAHVGDVLRPSQLVEAAATLVAVSAVGSAGGPLLAAVALASLGSPGVPLVLGATGVAMAVFAAWRLGARPLRTPTAHFVAAGSRSTAVGAAIVAEELVADDRPITVHDTR